jgi:hypothetical protein
MLGFVARDLPYLTVFLGSVIICYKAKRSDPHQRIPDKGELLGLAGRFPFEKAGGYS